MFPLFHGCCTVTSVTVAGRHGSARRVRYQLFGRCVWPVRATHVIYIPHYYCRRNLMTYRVGLLTVSLSTIRAISCTNRHIPSCACSSLFVSIYAFSASQSTSVVHISSWVVPNINATRMKAAYIERC